MSTDPEQTASPGATQSSESRGALPARGDRHGGHGTPLDAVYSNLASTPPRRATYSAFTTVVRTARQESERLALRGECERTSLFLSTMADLIEVVGVKHLRGVK